jgi:hypothetical protein
MPTAVMLPVALETCGIRIAPPTLSLTKSPTVYPTPAAEIVTDESDPVVNTGINSAPEPVVGPLAEFVIAILALT